MKLIMDEKVKHRLIGLAVIISLGAIFAPALIKKSSQSPESNFSVNVKLPPKPLPPDVVITDEKEVFKTIKVAKTEIPPIPVEKNQLTWQKQNPSAQKKTISSEHLKPPHLKRKERTQLNRSQLNWQ